MFFYPTEMHIQFVQVLEQCTERSTLCHLGKGVDILGEALATITELAVRSRDVVFELISDFISYLQKNTHYYSQLSLTKNQPIYYPDCFIP